MGAISFNLDVTLAQELTRLLPISLFVETGTFRGETLEQMHPLFQECISIEFSEEHYLQAKIQFQNSPNVHLHHGDSGQLLSELNSSYANRATLFWLDAHWCAADNTAGEKSQCPLLSEITGIGALHPDSAILIDDARLFLTPPPKPHEISDWPQLDAVIAGLTQLSSEHTLVYFNDVLLYLPRRISNTIRPFLQENTYNLLSLTDKARGYDTLLLQAKDKDSEINLLTQDIQDRNQVIHRLQANLIHQQAISAECSRDQTGDAKALINEVVSLKSQLDSSNERLKSALKKLQKYELTAHNGTHQSKPSPLHRFIRRWKHRLSQSTPHPLAKLRQYPPRKLKLERFPRIPRLDKWPRICVITPSYQQGHFLERTMLSVLNQGYPNLAYGVQDGGSTDESAEIINRYVEHLSHAESISDEGQSDAIQRGFKKLYPAENDIMCWLNSDDTLMPGTLHYVGAYFARHPEVDIVYGHRVVIDEFDQEISRWFMPQHHIGTLKWFDLVPQETMFWRSHCYHEVGGLDKSFQFALDWDLLLRYEKAGFNLHRLPYFLGCFRAHEEQKTNAKIKSVGEQEMSKLRRRIHGRDIPTWEVHRHLTEEIGRSAMIEWLHRYGVRC